MSDNEALVVWTQDEIDQITKRAHALIQNPENLKDYASAEFAEHTLLLGDVAKKCLKDAAMQEKPAEILRLAMAGGKLHGEWREMMLPMIKRLMKAAEKGKLGDEGQ